jgi:hypothetical protein
LHITPALARSDPPHQRRVDAQNSVSEPLFNVISQIMIIRFLDGIALGALALSVQKGKKGQVKRPEPLPLS